MHFEIKIQRQIGGDIVTITASDIVEAKERDEIKAHNLALTARALESMNAIEREMSAYFPVPKSSQPTQTTGEGTDTFVIDSIEFAIERGEPKVRILGGKWAKFGVPVYSEMLSALPINTRDYAELNDFLVGKTAIAQLFGGKPKRIIKIDQYERGE